MLETTLWIGWTTVEASSDAERLARELLEAGLAACVQLDGPIRSYYVWHEQQECAQEYRLVIKFPQHLLDTLTAWMLENHPYETPQWVCTPVSALPAYAGWAHQQCRQG